MGSGLPPHRKTRFCSKATVPVGFLEQVARVERGDEVGVDHLVHRNLLDHHYS